jgi:hypothetical protein
MTPANCKILQPSVRNYTGEKIGVLLVARRIHITPVDCPCLFTFDLQRNEGVP